MIKVSHLIEDLTAVKSLINQQPKKAFEILGRIIDELKNYEVVDDLYAVQEES